MPELRDLLVEIGTEELPPKALQTLSSAFTRGVIDGLKNASLEAASVESFAAPRRMGLLLRDLPVQQQDQLIEKRGPAKQAAFDAEGNPTKAALGFARSCGVDISDLQEQETDKGTWLVYSQQVSGKPTTDLIGEIVNQSLAKLPIPKRMRWGNNDTEFVRPVHWVVMLFGNNVVDSMVLGLQAGRESRGHRFHHNQSIQIESPAQYESQLEQTGKVLASFEKRRETIRQQAEQAASERGGKAQINDSLLDEVTALVEWPVAISGSFDKEFLEIPQECLISSMQDHQKYFPVTDENGKLLPHFITISNIESKDPNVVSQGNERVIRPRFSDAKFFWEQDCGQRLESHREKTKKIVFQQKLGTLFEKTERVASLARHIASLTGANPDHAARAAELSKCDLVSNMVQEFPELQGIMGRYYALNDGEPQGVALAMQEQYQPGFAGDAIPQGEIGQILSLADKLDTLLGIFAIGMKPTGTKDPFALRRAALGVLRILIEARLDLDLEELLQAAADSLKDKVEADPAVNETFDYIMERLRAYYQDQGIRLDTVDAVASLRPRKPLDFEYRVKAVSEFRHLAEAEPLAAANKRISNILKKADSAIPESVDEKLLSENQEKNLFHAINEQSAIVLPLFQAGNYTEALASLASLREDVDGFFDEVMVMTDDESLKNNRLALLSQLRNLFLQVADISRIQ